MFSRAVIAKRMQRLFNRNPQQTSLDMIQSYQQCFAKNTAGRKVLLDLIQQFDVGVMGRELNNVSCPSSYEQGQRTVIAYILEKLSIDPNEVVLDRYEAVNLDE